MKSTKPKLNVRLLRRIQKHILAEPRRFFMDWFIAKGTPGKQDFRLTVSWRTGYDLAKTVPPCGTAACIAGWANLFTNHRPTSDTMAEKELGLTGSQGRNLFNAAFWPEPFSCRYGLAKTPAARAKIAAARIDHLIKTGE